MISVMHMKHGLGRKSVFVITLVVALLGATFVGTSNASAMVHQHHRVLIGMGDSYTAGFSAPGYRERWETYPYDSEADGCFRSPVAYPHVADWVTRGLTAWNIACSGAKTTDLDTTFKTEPAQVNRLSGATDIVLTIGGNDIDALGAVANLPTPEEFAAELAALAPKLVATYTLIQSKAPDAHLYVMGYPIIFPAGPNSAPKCPPEATRDFLIQAQRALNQTIAAAAYKAGATYVDDGGVFAGHELCTPLSFVDATTAHPTQAGQVAMGWRLHQYL